MDHQELGNLLVGRLRTRKPSLHQVAVFTGAVDDTVEKWVKKGMPPRGERLNRLWHFLSFIGTDSPELQEVAPFNRYVGELMAFGLISLEEAQCICGGVSPQAALAIIRGERQPAKAMYTVDQLQAEYDEKLHSTKQRWRERLAIEVSAQAATPLAESIAPPEPATPTRQSIVPAADATTAFVLELAHLLGGLLPLLNYAISDRITPEDRDHLRQLLGPDGIFNIGTAIQALASERVRLSRQGGK